jgi:hypothetical protein
MEFELQIGYRVEDGQNRIQNYIYTFLFFIDKYLSTVLLIFKIK